MSRLKRSIKRSATPLFHAASPFLAAARPANVAMFHVGRVGSSVVANMLSRHSRIRWHHEFFNPRRMPQWTRMYGERPPMYLLRTHMALSRRKIFGFETKCLDWQDLGRIGLSLEDYLRELYGLGFTHFILLERKNLLRWFVSRRVGAIRRTWHTKSQATLTQITFNPEEARAGDITKPAFIWFEEVRETYEKLARLLEDQYVLHLTYEEDILENPRRAYHKVCTFLELMPEASEVDLRRTNPFPLSDILLNYEEVARSFRGSKHEWMLDT